jgi:hypothetical protein
MARVGRMAGAILAETRGQYFLVGNLKEPCDFEKQGFQKPTEIDAVKHPYIRLTTKRELSLAGPFLLVDCEGGIAGAPACGAFRD